MALIGVQLAFVRVEIAFESAEFALKRKRYNVVATPLWSRSGSPPAMKETLRSELLRDRASSSSPPALHIALKTLPTSSSDMLQPIRFITCVSSSSSTSPEPSVSISRKIDINSDRRSSMISTCCAVGLGLTVARYSALGSGLTLPAAPLHEPIDP